MNCNRNDCLHYEVCEEWKILGNENYINESNGRCDFYKREKIITCKDCENRNKCRYAISNNDYGYCSGAIRK